MSDLAAAIKECQRELQPMFAKPKLKSRLLSKPPFRYIHDIIIALLYATNFPAYFTEEELDSNTFKEKKNRKIEFLNKLIVLVNSHGNPVQVDARKIVAGLEPASTLHLLVEFGRLARTGVDAKSLSELCGKDVKVVEEEKEENVIEEEIKGDAAFVMGTCTETTASKDDFVEEEKDEENVEEEKDNDEIATDESHSKTLIDSLQNIITSASIIEQIYTE
ncbi:hypothetical protein ACHAWC_010652 [Mediolabrus comicus]